MKIRSLRPEFFADPKMANLSARARILYMGLWCYVDDEGRGEFLPKRIEGEVFPLEDIDFWDLWEELESIARVVRYQVEGHEYFHIPTLEDWQNPNRKYASKLPAPPPRSNGAAPAQRVDPALVPLGEVEGGGDVEGAAASDAYEVFHRKRARQEAEQQQQRGLRIKRSLDGLVKSIADREDFRAESERLWAHRDCANCRGKGSVEEYAPGAGTREVECEV